MAEQGREPTSAERKHADEVVQEASEESFPASDAPGWIGDAAPKPKPARPLGERPGRSDAAKRPG